MFVYELFGDAMQCNVKAYDSIGAYTLCNGILYNFVLTIYR